MTPTPAPAPDLVHPSRRRALAALVALAVGPLIPRPARALELSAPQGPVLLSVSGAIANANADGFARFDLAMLDALPQRETVTATPWHEGRRSFAGPTLAAVLEAAGATGTLLRIGALNDYAADMPAEDALLVPVILATRVDGVEMSVREKGPIFVIYPFDEHPELFNEVYFNRSVWQVATIEVLP